MKKTIISYIDQVNVHLDLRMAEKIYTSWKKTGIESKKIIESSSLYFNIYLFFI